MSFSILAMTHCQQRFDYCLFKKTWKEEREALRQEETNATEVCRQRKTLKIRQVWALSESWQPVCDSSCHFYPLTYASEHKKGFDFLKFPKK